MASRVKEDEKNERIIRGLLKLRENRRCMNCNGLGPQYVCTNFWTFVCTTCSGIHREFTHRVKSVSMAKFTSQEVVALQEGGNKRARDIYLKEWDPQRQSAPDGSNVDRLRDFIKHVYVDRRYSGDRNSGKSLSAKFSDKEDSYQGGSRSPPYEDTYERRYSEMSSPGGRSDDRTRYGYDERRSPGYDQESRQYNDSKRSPARPEVVNDWRREDRFGNGKKADDRRASDGESKLESRSPEHMKDPEALSPPVVRPVREILGDNVVPLRISEPPRANLRSPDGPVQTQRTASSSSLGSANGNATEVKMEKTVSLIDFDADPEPPVIATAPQTQQAPVSQTAAQPASTTSDNNWASFDFAPEVKMSQASTDANPLESVLTQLSGRQPGVPSGSGAPVAANAANITVSGATTGNPPLSTFNTGASPVTLVNSLSTFPSAGVSAAAPGLAPSMPVNGGNSSFKINEAGHWPNVQHQQPSLFLSSGGQPTTQQFTLSSNIASANQPWNMSLASNAQTASSTFVGAAQVVSSAAPGVAGSVASQPSVVEVKSSGRQELPADLFTSTYSPFPAQFHGWQTVPPRGMGFPIHYIRAAAPMPTSVHPSKTMNPFDLNEPLPVQAQTFPSMASLQGALPNMQISSGLQRTSSLGAPPPPSAWMPSHILPYPSALPGQSLPHASPMPRPYMAQQVPNNMPFSGHQGFGTEGSSFGGVNMDQQLPGKFSAPSPFSSVGGNPFG